jgi:hypothetical protein
MPFTPLVARAAISHHLARPNNRAQQNPVLQLPERQLRDAVNRAGIGDPASAAGSASETHMRAPAAAPGRRERLLVARAASTATTAWEINMSAKVGFGGSAGQGDPDLLTLKAVKP